MKHLAIYGNICRKEYIPSLREFIKMLSESGFILYIESEYRLYLESIGIETKAFISIKELPEDSETIISIGGDGTFLRATQWAGEKECPIVGLNTGHLGYLASYTLDEKDELIRDIKEERAVIEKRALLKMECACMPEDFWPYALNEVALLKGESASMVNIHAEIDGRYLGDYMSDGLLISTPTGSTAYNLSIGGPIIQPTIGCLVLSPIAPHSLTMRPLVVSGTSEISLKCESRTGMWRISLDGRSFEVETGYGVKVYEAPFKVLVLRRPEATFGLLLRNKLGWGKNPVEYNE